MAPPSGSAAGASQHAWGRGFEHSRTRQSGTAQAATNAAAAANAAANAGHNAAGGRDGRERRRRHAAYAALPLGAVRELGGDFSWHSVARGHVLTGSLSVIAKSIGTLPTLRFDQQVSAVN